MSKFRDSKIESSHLIGRNYQPSSTNNQNTNKNNDENTNKNNDQNIIKKTTKTLTTRTAGRPDCDNTLGQVTLSIAACYTNIHLSRDKRSHRGLSNKSPILSC